MVEHETRASTRGGGAQGDDAPVEAAGDRVAKALARAGVASRREVERLIEGGRVAVNGRPLTSPAVKVAAGDILTVDGAVVGEREPTRLFRHHKPAGLITSHDDPRGRPTVFAALPEGLPRLISVGRLDFNTEGLLLLTNDGALARALELPSTGWVRQYRARCFGSVDQARLDRLAEGVTVEGVRYGPIEARLDKAGGERTGGRNVWISVKLTEGKNREVRRVLEHLGLKVNRLLRLAYGPFQLGPLGVGGVEEVGPRVIREQLAGLVEAGSMPTGDRPLWTPAVEVRSRRQPTKGAVSLDAPGVRGRGATGAKRAAGGGARPAGRAAEQEPKAKLKRKPGWAKPKPRK